MKENVYEKIYLQINWRNNVEKMFKNQFTGMDYIQLIQPYGEAMKNITTRIETLILDYKLNYHSEPIHHMQNRIKTKESIQDKLKRKNLQVSVDNIKNELNDIAGIRVICYFIQNIFSIIEILKKQNDLIVIKECDYIDKPKQNGYRSYHIVFGVPVYYVNGKEYFPVEIQFRTLTMDLWASMEHQMCYKKNMLNSTRNDEFKQYAQQLKILEEEIESRYGE